MVTHCIQFFSKWWHRQQMANRQFIDCDFVVVDLELTGLDAKQHEVVSAAWLPITKQCIQLNDAVHIVNKDVKSLAQSPVFHGLCHNDVEQGIDLKRFTEQLAHAIEGKLVVFHHSYLDMAFIRELFRESGIRARPALILDTLSIERRRLLSQGHEIALDDLTLEQCRTRYGLPLYSSHHALTDALATAELLLAQSHQIGNLKSLKLGQLL
ncbi:exonuclease domain-containing protein [Pseudoalteromonas xiamenensis]|uniref:exonuclease domain-containing protein n=1 Tax=Pseudoalteromonas xiamenensis TaxID=882626 RepID=UPI0027E50017|nr:exonuclease domain-containing protein [Pseudoalteromonas xiamenensis]WMN59064.1 exonuclease domain-containing protein [Pseudoalteromonas xiamenensis]